MCLPNSPCLRILIGSVDNADIIAKVKTAFLAMILGSYRFAACRHHVDTIVTLEKLAESLTKMKHHELVSEVRVCIKELTTESR